MASSSDDKSPEIFKDNANLNNVNNTIYEGGGGEVNK